MNDHFLSVDLTGERKLLQGFDEMPDIVRAVLRKKVETWTNRLRDMVEDNIRTSLNKTVGIKPKKYSGSPRHLADSVEVEIVDAGLKINGNVYIRGIPYAEIQDSGGHTPPHVIRPREAKILAFIAASGDKVFATRVFHPGAVIPPTHYMRDAYRTMSPKVTDGLYYELVRKIKDRMR
jgi:hypothetical protein